MGIPADSRYNPGPKADAGTHRATDRRYSVRGVAVIDGNTGRTFALCYSPEDAQTVADRMSGSAPEPSAATTNSVPVSSKSASPGEPSAATTNSVPVSSKSASPGEPGGGQWISVNDKLPPQEVDLLYWFNGKWWPGKYLGPCEQTFLPVFGGKYGVLTGDVTHWMIPGSPSTKGEQHGA